MVNVSLEIEIKSRKQKDLFMHLSFIKFRLCSTFSFATVLTSVIKLIFDQIQVPQQFDLEVVIPFCFTYSFVIGFDG